MEDEVNKVIEVNTDDEYEDRLDYSFQIKRYLYLFYITYTRFFL